MSHESWLIVFKYIGEENGFPFYKKDNAVTEDLDPELIWNNQTGNEGWEVRINTLSNSRSTINPKETIIKIEAKNPNIINLNKCSENASIKVTNKDNFVPIHLCTKKYSKF